MKKLIAGFTALISFSCFAECTYYLGTKDLTGSQLSAVQKSLAKKDFREVSKEEAEFRLTFITSFFSQGRRVGATQKIRLTRISDEKVVIKGYGTRKIVYPNGAEFQEREYTGLLKTALSTIPHCKYLR